MRFLTRLANFWLLITMVSISAYFAVYNRDRVSLHLPPWIEQITMPGYIVNLAFFFLGAAVVTVYFGIDSLRKSLTIRRLRKKLREYGADDTETSSTGDNRSQLAPGEPSL